MIKSILKVFFLKNKKEYSDNKLIKYRKNINSVDKKIFNLLSKRSTIVNNVKSLKSKDKRYGLYIKPQREEELVVNIYNKYKLQNQFYSLEFYKHYLRYIISASNQLEQPNFQILYFQDSSIANIAIYYGLFCNITKHQSLNDCIKYCSDETVIFIPESYIISKNEEIEMQNKNITFFANTSTINAKFENNKIAGILKN